MIKNALTHCTLDIRKGGRCLKVDKFKYNPNLLPNVDFGDDNQGYMVS